MDVLCILYIQTLQELEKKSKRSIIKKKPVQQLIVQVNKTPNNESHVISCIIWETCTYEISSELDQTFWLKEHLWAKFAQGFSS